MERTRRERIPCRKTSLDIVSTPQHHIGDPTTQLTVIHVDELSRSSNLDEVRLTNPKQLLHINNAFPPPGLAPKAHVINKHVVLITRLGVLWVGGNPHLVSGVDLDLHNPMNEIASAGRTRERV